MTTHCRKPCPTCPWRVDQHAGSIPNFRLSLAEQLVASTGTELGAPIFACHQSAPEQEVVCVGWLVRYGRDSIGVRLRLMRGAMRREELEIGEDWPELHHTYEEVITKLRDDCAAQPKED